MNAAVGTPTGSRSGSRTVGSKAETASYARAPTAPPVNRGMPSVGWTRRRGTKARIASSGSQRFDRLDREVRRVGRLGHGAGLDAGDAVADLEQPPRPDAEERIAPEPLAALDRFEQVGGTAVIEAEEGADRGLEVGRARGAQEDRVGVGGEALCLRQTDRIGCRHRCWPRRIKTTIRLGDERSCLPRCHPDSAMPHSPDRRAGASPRRPIGAALYRWRSAPEPTGVRGSRRLAFGPEAPGAIPCRRRSGSHQPPDLWFDVRRVLVPFTARLFVMSAEYGRAPRESSSRPRLSSGAMDSQDHLRSVVDFYADRGDEDDRLTASALGQLEFMRTRELVERFLPTPPATVLDVGGGTGRYSEWLAGLGYSVHLIEPVPLHVEQASARAGAGPGFSVSYGHAGALPVADDSQDAVLLLGPLYHLPDPGDRERAWAESRRVVAPGGVVIAVAINRYAGVLDSLRHEFVDTGFARVGYFHPAGRLADEAMAAGLTVEGVFGVEGPGCLVTDLDTRWTDPAQRQAILDAARVVEAEPDMTGASHHTLVVARRDRATSGDR